MPGFDRTGPMGAGPKTGRGLGYCTPGGGSTYGAFGVGRGGLPWGGGRGRAWGGGRGKWFDSGRGSYPPSIYPMQYGGSYIPHSPSDEAKFLKDQLEGLREEMKATENRIKEIESEEKKKDE